MAEAQLLGPVSSKNVTPILLLVTLTHGCVALVLHHDDVVVLQVDLYEHAQILGNLISKGPVPNVETHCIYGEHLNQQALQPQPPSGWQPLPCSSCLIRLCSPVAQCALSPGGP